MASNVGQLAFYTCTTCSAGAHLNGDPLNLLLCPIDIFSIPDFGLTVQCRLCAYLLRYTPTTSLGAFFFLLSYSISLSHLPTLFCMWSPLSSFSCCWFYIVTFCDRAQRESHALPVNKTLLLSAVRSWFFLSSHTGSHGCALAGTSLLPAPHTTCTRTLPLTCEAQEDRDWLVGQPRNSFPFPPSWWHLLRDHHRHDGWRGSLGDSSLHS